MLVLTRQRDQTIIIGDDVQITVVDVRGDKVRLGITAPKEIPVYRKEIYDEIQREGHRDGHTKSAREASGQPHQGLGGDGHAHAHGIAEPGPAAESQPNDGAPASSAGAPPAVDQFMRAAIEEARRGLQEGGLPIGSVLVRNGQIIASGHNRRVQKGDPMAHAEIDCLTRAGRQQTYRDTVLYSTLMPCWLCSGAVLQFGIPKVVAGESVNFPGAADLLRRNRVEVVDLHDPECIAMMGDFIHRHPDLWHEDIGK